MAGPASAQKQKQKQQKQQQQQQQPAARSADNSSASRNPTQRSINKFDGNKDPHGHGKGVLDYTRPNDLKNLSEFLGMGGWYTARGVSSNAPFSARVCMHASNRLPRAAPCTYPALTAPVLHGVDAEHTNPFPRPLLLPHFTLIVLSTSLYCTFLSCSYSAIVHSAVLLTLSLPFVIMPSSGVLPMYQDVYSYRPRHNNMIFNSQFSQLSIPASIPQRPKNFNTYGKETTIMLNTFNVVKPPSIIVHQYDVAYSGDSKDYTKRKLLQKIWNSKALKAELGEPANLWVWDGHKLAW